MSDTVRVQTQDQNPWWTRWYENFYAGTPGGRTQEVKQPGSVRKSPVGQPEPERFGISGLGGGLLGFGRGVEKQTLNAVDALSRFFSSQPQAAPGQGLGSLAYSTTPTPAAETDRRASSTVRGRNRNLRARPPFDSGEPAAMTFEDWLAANTGTFDESPYRNYMDFLMQQDEETMARINAMYSQLADSAGANMQRVADVYDSARIQSGDVFGGSAQNIEDAYSSASQQAADQMARLGIEAAAPAVLNPMALSQAEAVSGIERAGTGALDALTRYGASAQDFGGQMAQVGQQQGLEVTSSILRDMQQRQAEAMFQMEQARAGFNPYANAMQRMEMENAFNAPMLRAEEQARTQAFEMAKEQVRAMSQYDNDIMRDVRDLMGQGYDYNDAIEIITNTRMYNPYQQ
jgi:hypothetical protein